MTDLAELARRLGSIPLITNEKAVRAKSRDFFWYSPVLKAELDDVTARAVVAPRNEAEVLACLAACYALDIPVTPRGGGTGNYGQAMPLIGGIVLDISGLNAITSLQAGSVTCGAGALMGAVQSEALQQTGQEWRMHPSTLETATIGGFVAGGSGGVGSIRWGLLYEPGNIRRLRIATLEAQPRLLDLTGDDIQGIHHAYGTTGVITEVEMPLEPAEDWVELIIAYEDWDNCVAAGWDLLQGDVLLKQLAAIEAPAPHRYFLRHRKFLRETDNVLCVLAARRDVGKVLAQSHGRCAYRSDLTPEADRQGLPHLHHLCWNHTTLRALRVDPEMTYLQLGPRPDDPLGSVRDVARMFPDEILNHVEFTRGQGQPRLSMLPMLRYRGKARLDQIILALEAAGILNWNPHVCTLEEGNHRDPDPAQIALKRAHDPKGLLNPGKLIGWDDPGYKYDPKGGYWAARKGR